MQAAPERGLHVVGELHALGSYHLGQGFDQLVCVGVLEVERAA